MSKPEISIQELRKIESRLIRFSIILIINGIINKKIRNTGHYREWYNMPLNYARIMELPIAINMLGNISGSRILDVSSPKLAALYLSSQKSKLTTADLEEYFLDDFRIYKKYMALDFETAVFNAAMKIPYQNASFDKAYSISVLEHIPGDGDRKALLEMLRILKPTGSLVITLPVFMEYVEEWTIDENYWRSVQDNFGRTFFQRRYSREIFMKLVDTKHARIETITLIAERPLKKPELSTRGVMMHNSYLIEMVSVARNILKLQRKLPFLPLMHYIAERVVSSRCHYLTTDWSDPNIRQVAVRLVKN